MSRISNRVDTNSEEIKNAFKFLGWEFIPTPLGRGFPDGLAVKYIDSDWYTLWIEIKTDKGHLTKSQDKFHEKFSGLVYVVRNTQDVIDVARGKEDHIHRVTEILRLASRSEV